MKRLIAILLLAIPTIAFAQSSSWVNGLSFQGQEVTVDLPEKYQIRNIGSRIDNAGMCVFSSIEMAAEWHGLDDMKGWRDWCANNYPGGGYPEKVDQLLAEWWRYKNLTPIPYIQYEGTDPQAILNLCDKTNRCACITYGHSPRYISRINPQGRISHMVCLVGFKTNAVVLDNNFIGEKNMEWMPTRELIRRNMLTANKAWVFVWRTPGAPPIPKGHS